MQRMFTGLLAITLIGTVGCSERADLGIAVVDPGDPDNDGIPTENDGVTFYPAFHFTNQGTESILGINQHAFVPGFPLGPGESGLAGYGLNEWWGDTHPGQLSEDPYIGDRVYTVTLTPTAAGLACVNVRAADCTDQDAEFADSFECWADLTSYTSDEAVTAVFDGEDGLVFAIGIDWQQEIVMNPNTGEDVTVMKAIPSEEACEVVGAVNIIDATDD